MSCEKYRDLFDSVFDKEIKESRKKKLFAHLDGCQKCSLEFKLYSAVIEGMEKLEEVEAPLDLTRGVMAGIQSSQPPVWEGQPMPFLQPASSSWIWAGAFAVAFFLMIGTFVNHDGNHDGGGSKQAQLSPKPVHDGSVELPHLGEDRNTDELAPKVAKAPGAPGAPDAGIVLVQHQGDVEVYDATTDRWRAIHGQENLNFGERVRTGQGGVASLEYRTENVALRIKPNSTFQVLDRQNLRVFAGNVWVSVKRKGTVFKAETPNAIASVRGTKYSVEVQPLTDVYSAETVLGLNRVLLPEGPNGAPRASASLPAYSAYVALTLARQLADGAIPVKVNTQVKVYESVVEVIAKNSAGVEVSSIDVSEGLKSSVQLASVARPGALTQSDLLEWKGVMVFDEDLIKLGKSKVSAASSVSGATAASSAGHGAGTPATLVAPPVGGVPAATDSGPSSDTHGPGFDGVNRR